MALCALGNVTGATTVDGRTCLTSAGDFHNFTGTLAGNITLGVANLTVGLHTVELTQDGTGGRTVAYSGDFQDGPSLTDTSPGVKHRYLIVWDGTKATVLVVEKTGGFIIGIGSGSGDFSSNTASSVDSELLLFSGTLGKTGKRATGSGVVTATSGVYGTTTQPAGNLVGTTATQTLTNKQYDPRVVALTDAATVTPDVDTTDVGVLATLSQATNFANPTGTPVSGRPFILRITSSTARALTWGTSYAGNSGTSLPTTTSGSSLTDYFGFRYNAASAKFEFVASTGATESSVTASSVTTFTNKTFDVNAAGNVITLEDKVKFPAAICRNATAESLWSTPTSNPAVAACITGANTQKGVMDFADGSNLSMQTLWALPSDWLGNIHIRIKWTSNTSSATPVVWSVATACEGDNESGDPAFNTSNDLTDTAKATAGLTNDLTSTNITITGCAAGDILHLKISRDSGLAGDTHAGTARIIEVELTISRSQ